MPAEIKPEAKLQAMIDQLQVRAQPAMTEALDAKLIPLVVNAKRNWPKKTGFSASILKLRVELENGKIVKYIEDNAPYAAAIKFKDTEIFAVDNLILEPVEAALTPILEAFARGLANG